MQLWQIQINRAKVAKTRTPARVVNRAAADSVKAAASSSKTLAAAGSRTDPDRAVVNRVAGKNRTAN